MNYYGLGDRLGYMPKWQIADCNDRLRNEVGMATTEDISLARKLDLEIFGVRGFSRNVHRVNNGSYKSVEVEI